MNSTRQVEEIVLVEEQYDELEWNSVHEVYNGAEEARSVIIVGKPLNEPVAWQGPFVMKTQKEIEQAFEDFRDAKNDFENARNWRSEWSQKNQAAW